MSRWAICRRRTGRPTDRWRSGTRRSVRCCGTPHRSSAPPRRWWKASRVGRRKGGGGPSTGCWPRPSKWPGRCWSASTPESGSRYGRQTSPSGSLLELGAGLAGVVLVTVNPAYKPKELEVRAAPVRRCGHLSGARVPGQPHGGEPGGGPHRTGRAQGGSAVPGVERLPGDMSWVPPSAQRAARRTRPDPVHVGHDRIPEGGAAAPPGR